MSIIWLCSLIILNFLVRGIDVQLLDGGDTSHLPNQGICESIDVRNSADKLEVLRNCTIIVGYLQIVLLEGYVKLNQSRYEFPNLREVTQFIIFYRAEGLDSIGRLFPNLSLIRGQKLFHNYALIIFELPQLTEIGLRSLTTIQRGYVRIAQNPQLCYSKTVDWGRITGRSVGHYIHNNGPNSCPGSDSCRGCDDSLCWSSKHCQRFPSPTCHSECLGGCTLGKNHCLRCKHLVDNGVCVSSCPPEKFEHPSGFMCVTKELCKKMYRGTGWTWKNFCIRRCPKSYKTIVVNGTKSCEFCGNRCNVTCLGSEVQTLDELQYYKGCNIINGSLYIKFASENKHSDDVMQELTDNFIDIQEIYGILKIYRSDSITSFSFLKNLTVIHGKDPMYDKYSLVVHEMYNLQKLWDDETTSKLKILNGTLFFHYNAKLCYKEIEKLIVATNTTVLPNDVSRISNGHESHCHLKTIKTNHTVLGPKLATIQWDRIMQPQETDTQLGYMIFYMEEPPYQNLTHFARDTCYDKGWKTKYVEEPNDINIQQLEGNLTDLKPFTEYAYYVESYYKFTVMSKNLSDGQSEINYFKTAMDDPKMPVEVEAHSISHNILSVTWEDEPTYNGIINHYLIEAVLQYDDVERLDKRDYCVYPIIRKTDVVKKKPKVEIQDEIEKFKKTRKCFCTTDEWNKYVNDEVLLNITKEHIENDTKQFKMWCEQFSYNSEPPETEQEFMKRLSCKTKFVLNAFMNEDLMNDDNEAHIRLERDANYALDIQKIVGKPSPRVPIKNHTVDNVHQTFSTHYFGSFKNFTLDNVQHYGKYLIFVSACTSDKAEDCGPYTFIVHRTKENPRADDITTLEVNVLTTTSVEVIWKEPENPNGAIVSYTLEYFKVEPESKHVLVQCITRKQHAENQMKFPMNLKAGKYGVRVKAHSLAGDGDFTSIYYFSTESMFTTGWLIFLGFCFLVLCVVAGVWRWYRRKIVANNVDTVNLVPLTRGVRYVDYESDEDLDRIDFYDVNN